MRASTAVDRVSPRAIGPRALLSAALGALALAGCAASPAPVAVAAPPPHPILAEAAPADPTRTEHDQPNSEHESRQMNRALGWVLIGVGAEGAILATVTSFMMLHQNSVRSDSCADKVCSAAGITANGTLHSLAPWNAAAWGVAAVGTGVGLFLLLTNPSDKALHTEVGVAPTGSGSGLLLRGAF
jgi:hypothetical protein